MEVSKHYHKLRRGTYKTGTLFFKCIECPFVAMVHHAVGRPVRCWKCDNPFVFGRIDAKWAKPKCPECRSTPVRLITPKRMDDFLEELVKEDKK